MARTKTKTRRRAPARRAPRSTAIARRTTTSPAVRAAKNRSSKLEVQLKRAKASARKVKKDYEAQTMPVAAMNSGLVVVGGGLSGALKALTGRDYVARVAIEVPAAGACIAAGVYFQRPEPLYLAAGMLAPVVAQGVDELVTGLMDGEGVQLPTALFDEAPEPVAANANP